MRRLLSRGLGLRRLFSETQEIAEDTALTKAGLLLQRSQPKAAPSKKSVFIKPPPPKEKEADAGIKLESLFQKEDQLIERAKERPPRQDNREAKQGQKKERTEKEKGPRTSLPTAAESLKDEIQTYVFPGTVTLSQFWTPPRSSKKT